jgi:TonB-linked SusC/RagA family outer membrane protein
MRKLTLLLVMLLVTLSLWAQQRTIRGRVTDNKGAPVAGATVSVRGQNVSTQTNDEGVFTIQAATGSTLIITNIGFGTREISVGADSDIAVSLAEQSRELSEVIVTAGGVRREVRTLGYSAPTIRNEELTRARERSVLNSLQGKVAGVNITSSSGGVGSSTRIVFRGGTSLLGNNQALIVVDGIPIDNSQIDPGDNLNNQVDPGNRGNDINPEDVESVTVLKGPAAAALYGSRAANGALIITTKRGSRLGAKRTEVTLTSAFSLESILKLPEYQNEYGQGVDKDHPDLRENWSWGPKFDGVVRPWGQVVEGEQRVKPYIGLPDNVKEFFDVGQVFNNGITLSQNNERNSYYVSFNNINQKGIMPGTEYKRTSVRLTGTAELSKKFYSNATINYIRSNGDLSVQGQGPSPYDQVLQTPRDISLLELKDYKNNKFNTPLGYYGAYTVNPWWYLGEDSYTSTVNRILGNLEIGYRPAGWLDVIYRIGTDVTSDFRRQIQAKMLIPAGTQNADNSFEGAYSEQSIGIRELTSDLMATGKFNLNENFSLRALLGHNYRQRVVTESYTRINDLVIPNLYVLTNTAGSPTSNNLFPDFAERRLFGVYGDLNIGFKNYLFLGITGRNDWSSTLPQNNNSFFYPSANLSFVFSDAFSMPSWLSYGKLRVSGAKVGNDADPYLLQSVFVPGTISDGYNNSQVDMPFNGIPGYTLSTTIGNPNLTPEFTTSYEGGIEAAFFKNRLGIDATYYRNKTTDQIITLPIAATSGYTFRVSNVGQVSNKGVEVLLRGQPIRSRNFNWEVTTTFSKNKSNVDKIAEGTSRITLPGVGFSGGTIVAEVGQPYGQFFGSGFQRDSLGRIVVSATTGYPVTEPVAKTYGSYQPDFMASLFNSFSFKGFTLTALLDGRKGGVFFSRTRTLQSFVGTDPRTLYNDREPFVIPNSSILDPATGKYVENTSVKVDNVINYWTTFVSNNAMENLVDASFLKLREVSLSYTFNKELLRRMPFTGLQVGLIGRNLWLKTADENTYSDPETSSFGTGNGQGYEYGSIPSVRSYGANIRVTF